jgi:autoinducer 2-degrading protein
MACTFLARFRIKPEKEADFLALVPRIEAISRDEPFTLAYRFYRLAEPHMFAVLESFVDESGDRRHQENPPNVALIGDILACMDGTYSREYLYDVAQAGPSSREEK